MWICLSHVVLHVDDVEMNRTAVVKLAIQSTVEQLVIDIEYVSERVWQRDNLFLLFGTAVGFGVNHFDFIRKQQYR